MTVYSVSFHNSNAQAWFRSALHRASALSPRTRETALLLIRDGCYGEVARLTKRDAQLALEATRGRVGPDDSPFYEARMEIVKQLRSIVNES